MPHLARLLRPRRERPAAAALPRSVMNSRRRMYPPKLRDSILSAQTNTFDRG